MEKSVTTITQVMKENETSKYFLVYNDGSKLEVNLFDFGTKLREMSEKGVLMVSRPNVYVLTYSLKP